MNLTPLFHLCVLFVSDKVLQLCSRKEWETHQGFWIFLLFVKTTSNLSLVQILHREEWWKEPLWFFTAKLSSMETEIIEVQAFIYLFFLTVYIDCAIVTPMKNHNAHMILLVNESLGGLQVRLQKSCNTLKRCWGQKLFSDIIVLMSEAFFPQFWIVFCCIITKYWLVPLCDRNSLFHGEAIYWGPQFKHWVSFPSPQHSPLL